MIGVLGARGRIGRQVVSGLAAQGVDAVALVRRDPGSGGVLPEAQADLRSRDELVETLASFERLLLLTPHGPDQDLLEANAIAAAKEAGVGGIVKISGTPATLGPNGPTSTAVSHWRSERLIEEAGFDFVHLRPSFMMQNLLSTLAPVMRERGRAISPLADEQIAMVDARDVAAAAVELLGADELGGRALALTGPRAVTHREIAAQLGRRLVRIPRPLVSRAVRANTQSEWEAAHVLRMLAFYRSGADGIVNPDLERITGTRPRSIESFLEEEAAQFSKSTQKGNSN